MGIDYLADKAIQYKGQISGMTADQIAVTELCEAIRLTVEYVGTDILPPLRGWSWFDALSKHDPATAQRFVEWHAQHARCASCKHASHVGGECGAPITETYRDDIGFIAKPSGEVITDIVGLCNCGADVLPRPTN